MGISKGYYQCTLSFAKHINCLIFLKQQDNFTNLPQTLGYKAHKQREYDRIQVTAE